MMMMIMITMMHGKTGGIILFAASADCSVFFLSFSCSSHARLNNKLLIHQASSKTSSSSSSQSSRLDDLDNSWIAVKQAAPDKGEIKKKKEKGSV